MENSTRGVRNDEGIIEGKAGLHADNRKLTDMTPSGINRIALLTQ